MLYRIGGKTKDDICICYKMTLIDQIFNFFDIGCFVKKVFLEGGAGKSIESFERGYY
ncbi:MAG: hypothetical protein LBG48_02300 [Rickettsiales bacterium]|nr:hypothetical protein [Rickettsiales bacterium]